MTFIQSHPRFPEVLTKSIAGVVDERVELGKLYSQLCCSRVHEDDKKLYIFGDVAMVE